MPKSDDTLNLTNAEFADRLFKKLFRTRLTEEQYGRRHPEFLKTKRRMNRAFAKADRSTAPDKCDVLARTIAKIIEEEEPTKTKAGGSP